VTPAPAPVAPKPVVTATPEPAKKKDLVASALASGKLDCFVKAIDKPLENATLFAPVDEACTKIDPARRGKVIRHHIVPGKTLVASDFSAEGGDVPTLDGSVYVRMDGGEIYVDDLRVIARIEAANGIIYALPEAIDPDAPPDVRARIARISPSFSKLVEQSGILDGAGPFTVFVPTDAALGALVPPIDAKKIVSRHATRGRVAAADLPKLKTLKMLAGADIAPSDLRVVRPPSNAKNGLVYVVDAIVK
jgi:uncharacterized surface protein with fasciclin (FAS1) repeats